ncbi:MULTISPECIES: NADH-quinone oxidoreductase subunit E [Brucella/Ochrobactrum group]|jgi:NADH-quinone oxidoreductase subunit E|uniref:NADH-quinone oxidoreductase subunit E n=1 Tax=Brucella pseudintermedia TaxID=370111 RepID=A0ABY5UB23_9HYPH|nr:MULTISPECIES: NADH-quinone oxidoreductase subunit E [Brucella/Ochrobactrum group]KAB2680664.1 NADH-quinone oxidoreductase subunit E [Brucella pseudintermedia]MCO7725945.1 NADH-quinone oxidoreductase subunit E [Brucella intermedia]NKE77452.1 NADH-quinone oxidoreductase subunit E [Ochrobactrum sp. MC-1LL]TWG95669.1 NADH dehydrogenase subunit E [Ochrobactrum sp. J50]UWL60519.1 NADH-quinone oxidoreductase subunit E [Brucella pseudintermedia]
MSVRRLADDAVQPAAFAFNAENQAWAHKTIAKFPEGRQQSAVIPLLMRAQEQEGWVTKAAIEHVAGMLDMPLIRVLEVATFYTQFQLKPVGTRAHIQVCGTTPCMLRGSEALMDVCRHKINHDPFELNADGTLSWEEVECQGACANAPMVMIFKDAYEDLTPERLAEIIDAFEAGKGDTVKPGPQIDRETSNPINGLTSLTEDLDYKKIGLETRKASDAAAAKAKAEAEAKAKAEAEVAAATPSNTAKPVTNAPETAPALKSPSDVKVSNAAEKAASVEAKQVYKLDDKNRPVAMERPEVVDDLKLIAGVGPKIEATLHELGIFTYKQVAAWKKAEREWVDGYLSFHGRIEREDWVKQAKALAKGGVEEYIKVFGKKPV